MRNENNLKHKSSDKSLSSSTRLLLMLMRLKDDNLFSLSN